ncbi:MAG: hypothetical protein KBD52_01625 [Candidatus Pacebacteria bacterium]|nr:hypothetical protein [Candidatus Paceibacterota bacterium]
MITPELISFIKSELAKGKLQEQIRSELATGGWNASDLEEAFSFILKIPVQPIQPTQIVKPAQPIQSPISQPITPIIQPIQAGFVSANSPISSKPKSHSKVLLFFVIFLIIFGAAFAGWYFFKPEIMKMIGINNDVSEVVITPDQIPENVISDVNLDYSSERWKPFNEDVLGLNFSYPAGLEYKSEATILNRLHRFTFADSAYTTRISVGFRTFPVLESDTGDSDACAEEVCSKQFFEGRKNRSEIYKNSSGIIFYVYEGMGDDMQNYKGTIEANFETNNSKFPYVTIWSDKIPKMDFLKILDTFKLKEQTITTQKTINLGTEFSIKKGEKVVIENHYGATFKLTDFYYHPCPEGAQCIWSGLDVFYEIQLPEVKNSDGSIMQKAKLFVKNEPLQSTKDMPFSITVKDSDYKTYAKVILQSQGIVGVDMTPISFLEKLVKEHPFADIKECRIDAKQYISMYPNTMMADAETTFYTSLGVTVEQCGGYKQYPDPESSLCRKTLNNCIPIYYYSERDYDKYQNVDVYNLK